MAVAEFYSTVLDTTDPKGLAAFYADLLGGTVDDSGEWVAVQLPGGQRLGFQHVEAHEPPVWPHWPGAEGDPQQSHLDLKLTGTHEEAEQRVRSLGGRVLDADDDGGKRPFRVYADPAGHPFCLGRF
ncbi:VOC family protein [Streptomyces sp. YC504]|uniref:VOC family protein n=1 Tax=Streptomyces mesophilus TaxID=1775132 RepID=A0A6G4XG77_9ACTN|nr:VOC family protein [Streptomyces mesophilus]NGO75724.1 VOC family protein [Streptomyces mesophilus]